jgi:hypothetical protein
VSEWPKKSKAIEFDKDCESHPTLNWHLPDGTHCQMAFGFLSGEPMAALFVGDLNLVLIPREAMQIAVQDGWEGLE